MLMKILLVIGFRFGCGSLIKCLNSIWMVSTMLRHGDRRLKYVKHNSFSHLFNTSVTHYKQITNYKITNYLKFDQLTGLIKHVVCFLICFREALQSCVSYIACSTVCLITYYQWHRCSRHCPSPQSLYLYKKRTHILHMTSISLLLNSAIISKRQKIGANYN